MSTSETIEAIAAAGASSPSAFSSGTYTINLTSPTFTIPATSHQRRELAKSAGGPPCKFLQTMVGE